jgi:hypothetical protein
VYGAGAAATTPGGAAAIGGGGIGSSIAHPATPRHSKNPAEPPAILEKIRMRPTLENMAKALRGAQGFLSMEK